MSRAFVKEDGPEPEEDPAERPISPQPNYVTPRGLSLLRRSEETIAAELETFAGAQEDSARRKRKRTLERDLRYTQARIEGAILVDPERQPREQIRFGATVLLKREDGREKSLRIVGEDEAEEGGQALSWAAPFAQTLFGLKAGQTLYWETAAGPERWVVASISYL